MYNTSSGRCYHWRSRLVYICLNCTQMYIHKYAHIYSAIIVCKHCEGIGLLSSPGHDDAWDLLQLPQTSKVEKLKRSELRTKTLITVSLTKATDTKKRTG